jgi:hypothetical protein
MRREQLFSRTGYYRHLLDINVLLHREAAEFSIRELRSRLTGRDSAQPLRVLDLACGGLPVTIAGVLGAFPGCTFEYTGIDVNPDQVEMARREFRFPPNVSRVRIIEGNAWELDEIGLEPGYELIYSGMNLHHGTPEEISFLGLQLLKLLGDPGLFISHDVYRPDREPYRRRPDRNPDNPQESFLLVDPAKLAKAGISGIRTVTDDRAEEPAWRQDYLGRMREILGARGADPAGIESTVWHMAQRDYPVSTWELRELLQALGWAVKVHRYPESREPMQPYVAICAATRMLESPP